MFYLNVPRGLGARGIRGVTETTPMGLRLWDEGCLGFRV